jgi:hypothetical protein
MICFYTASEEAKNVIAPPGGDTAVINESDFEHGWQRQLFRFWQADKSFCDQRFKLIPNVVRLIIIHFPLVKYRSLRMHINRAGKRPLGGTYGGWE